MRIRNVGNAKEILESCPYCFLDWKKVPKIIFENNNPIHIEIGMGKGQFLLEMAKTYPEVNFIGIERYDSIIARAIEKIGESLPNLRIIRMDAKDLKELFTHKIDTIYLNFSDPWPKKRHAKRRLTSTDFLEVYDHISKKNPNIIMKTDNDLLFESSVMSLNSYGYVFDEIYLDITNSELFNIETEYEQKFKKKGQSIHYLRAHKK